MKTLMTRVELNGRTFTFERGRTPGFVTVRYQHPVTHADQVDENSECLDRDERWGLARHVACAAYGERLSSRRMPTGTPACTNSMTHEIFDLIGNLAE